MYAFVSQKILVMEQPNLSDDQNNKESKLTKVIDLRELGAFEVAP